MKAKLIKTHNKWWQLWDSEGKCLANTINENGFTYKLSLKNCQAIERGYDLDELADKYEYVNYKGKSKSYNIGFKHGFQKALELLGDKKFSQEDMKNAIQRACNDYNGNIIESLQQTEWELEICCHIKEDNGWLDADTFNSPMLTSTGEPKLDADGCLILKTFKSE